MRFPAPYLAPPGTRHHNGDPVIGSVPDAEGYNMLWDELCHLVEFAGLALSEDDSDKQQVRKAIGTIVEAMITAAISGAAGAFLRRDVPDVLTAGFFTAPVPVAIAAGHVALPMDQGNVFTIAVDAPFTLDFPPSIDLTGAAGMMLVVAKQDAAGGRTLTLASGLKLASGTWDTTANAVNLMWITSDGSGTALDVVIAQRGA